MQEQWMQEAAAGTEEKLLKIYDRFPKPPGTSRKYF